MELVMVLMRGLPGSGKSTLAKEIALEHDAVVCSTDDFWVGSDGEYRFDPWRLGEAHEWNQERCKKALLEGRSVVVDNCNVKKEHMRPYLEMAERYGIVPKKVVAPLNGAELDFLASNNAHGVPLETIAKMRRQWEDEE